MEIRNKCLILALNALLFSANLNSEELGACWKESRHLQGNKLSPRRFSNLCVIRSLKNVCVIRGGCLRNDGDNDVKMEEDDLHKRPGSILNLLYAHLSHPNLLIDVLS